MREKKKEKMNRMPYEKPKFEQIRLVPEEAVLSACKTVSPGPFLGPLGLHFCYDGQYIDLGCYTQGS